MVTYAAGSLWGGYSMGCKPVKVLCLADPQHRVADFVARQNELKCEPPMQVTIRLARDV